MPKLKPNWVKTDISKDTKIKLWRVMKANFTYGTFTWYVSSHFDDIFDKDDNKYGFMSRQTYKALQDEIREMPIQEVQTLPPDLQTWVQQLRPELASIPADDKSASTLANHVIAESLGNHWTKLTKLAQELVSCLEFYSVLTPKIINSVENPDFLGLDSPHCFFDGSRVWFSVEDNPLYDCLFQHLSTEIPQLSEKLEQVRELAAKSFAASEENKTAVSGQFRDDNLVSDLRHTLWLVAERATFKGKCDVCKDW